jgi:hypothetical protein
MATKATVKKAAPKKAVVKKAGKFVAPAVTIFSQGNEHILKELGLTEDRAHFLEDKAGQIYEGAKTYGETFQLCGQLAESANELYFLIFSVGAIAAAERAAQNDPLAMLLPLMAAAHAANGGRRTQRPTRTNVQGQRKDGNGKR